MAYYGTNGYFYYNGNFYDVGKTHIDWFLENYEKLGFTKEEMDRLFAEEGRVFDTNHLAEDDIMRNKLLIEAMKHGAIRIRFYRDRTSIQCYDHTQKKSHDALVNCVIDGNGKIFGMSFTIMDTKGWGDYIFEPNAKERINRVINSSTDYISNNNTKRGMKVKINSNKSANGKKPINSRIYREMSFRDFEPWSGAVETYNRIMEEGKEDEFEAMLEDMYPDGIDETELNDLLWFDEDSVYEWLGIEDEPEEEEDEPEEEESDDEDFLGNSRRPTKKVIKNSRDTAKVVLRSSRKSIKSSEGRVLTGEEKDNVLRQILKEQGYSDSDIAIMLSQSAKRSPKSCSKRKSVKSTMVYHGGYDDDDYDSYRGKREYHGGHSDDDYEAYRGKKAYHGTHFDDYEDEPRHGKKAYHKGLDDDYAFDEE